MLFWSLLATQARSHRLFRTQSTITVAFQSPSHYPCVGTTTRRKIHSLFQQGLPTLSVGLTVLPGYAKSHFRHLAAAAGRSVLISSKSIGATAFFATPTAKDGAGRPYRLVIVESPSKCKTIEKILEQFVKDNSLSYDFVVASCKGHIRNLPKKNTKKKGTTEQELLASQTSSFPYRIPGIDLENKYKPTYEIIPEKKAVVKQLRDLAVNAEQVLLATDPDREGEAMAWHLIQVLSEKIPKKKDTDNDFYRRISFTEITTQAVTAAVMDESLLLNPALVQAQETRRVLDRLCGYTVSPVLWKKVAPGLSAGRVQSVALALTVQRERERLVFEQTDYASLEAALSLPGGAQPSMDITQNMVYATLYSLNETTVASSGDDFTSQGGQLKPGSLHKRHLQIDDAMKLVDFFQHYETSWFVKAVVSTQKQRSPPLPYRTSTLQQDAISKLGLSVSNCMRAAQQLYEQGLISYMRTDSSTLSQDAENAVKATVSKEFGKVNYRSVPGAAEASKSKKKESESSRFAQEAHEAIRPSIQADGMFLPPSDGQIRVLSTPCQQLYRMIYLRTLASRMLPMITNQTQVQIEASRTGTTAEFRASGSIVLHPGYTLVYGAGSNGDKDDDEYEGKRLPPLKEGQALSLVDLEAVGHKTKPPARYTEASLVRELEALGVGRPSTYAGIVQILRDRAYVGNPPKGDEAPSPQGRKKKLEKGTKIAHRAAGGIFTGSGGMVPSLSAFVVCELLEEHCPLFVDPAFTASMEEHLDKIASNEMSSEKERIAYLDEYYAGENGLAETIKRIDDNVDANVARRAILPSLQSTSSDCAGDNDEVGLFVGPWGPYVRKVGHPTGAWNNNKEKTHSAALPPDMCADLSSITPSSLRTVLSTNLAGGLLLGNHPDDGRPIRLKTGRYGAYLQWGNDGEENTTRHSLPHDKAKIRSIEEDGLSDRSFGSIERDEIGFSATATNSQLSFEEAVGYVSLPRVVTHMEDGTQIFAGLGPYGPYLKFNNTFVSIKKQDGDALTIDGVKAVRLVKEHASRPKRGEHGVIANLGEKNGDTVLVRNGRFGPYLSWGKVNAKLLPECKAEKITLDQAWSLLQPSFACSAKTSDAEKGSQPLPSLPPPPKRPLSAYLHFCAAKRPQVAKKGKSFGEFSKELSRMWKDTDQASRLKYVELASRDKKEYEAKRLEWNESCNSIVQEAKGNRKEEKMKSDRPKVDTKIKR